MRLLVVEDDALISRSLVEALTPLGNTVEVFACCSDARAALRQGGVDLMLLDIGLPDGDGLSLLAELRDAGDRTPVIILTAHGSIPDAVSATRQGVFSFLTKPVDRDELFTAIDEALLQAGQDCLLLAIAEGATMIRVGSRLFAGLG